MENKLEELDLNLDELYLRVEHLESVISRLENLIEDRYSSLWKEIRCVDSKIDSIRHE